MITEPRWKSFCVTTTNPLFSPKQCQMIIEAGRAEPRHNATVGAAKEKGGIVDTETEKLKELAENIEFKDEQDFSKKLDTIKESYFPKTKIEEDLSKDEVDSVAANGPAVEASSDAMAAYTAAISRNLKKLKA